MKVAAYQAPVPLGTPIDTINLLAERVRWCESQGIRFLCCPEALIGGLADYAERPADLALNVARGQLRTLLEPLTSEVVTTIIGFTEIAGHDELYNSAAILHHGAIAGIYRKQHPAIRRSIYQAGERTLVVTLDGLKFGIIICNDSNYPETAHEVAAQGANVLFVPTNNLLVTKKADVVKACRDIDVALAKENRLWVVRADVSGRSGERLSYGSSSIVDPSGTVVQTADQLSEDTLIAEIEV